MKLIDKEKVIEEIKKLEAQNNCGTSDFIEAKEIAFNQVKQALDSIEVKEVKEVDFYKELAKHFFKPWS